MPSHMPSSFASAAAGQTANRDSRASARDGRGSGEWSRRDARTNGTLTFRRSSTAPYATNPTPSENTSPEVLASQLPTQVESERRYARSMLLDIFRAQQDQLASDDDVARLFVNNWDPGHSNGTNGRGWGKGDGRDHNHAPDVCWDTSGQIHPIGLEDMSDLERSLFTSDVNSPLKPPPAASKEQSAAVNGRKTSVSQGTSEYPLNSPSGRPGTRRRETAESNPYAAGAVASPGVAGRFARDEFFGRRPDPQDDDKHDDGRDAKNAPLGTLLRSNTGPGSPWSAQGGAVPTMGNFGSFAMPSPAMQEKRPAFANMRGESRLAHLMPKSTEDMKPDDKGAEALSWRSRPRTDTDPFSESAAPSGPARDDTSPSSDDALGTNPQYVEEAHEYHEAEANSPGETNPYRSPFADRELETDDLDEALHHPHPNLGMHDAGMSFPRGFHGTFDGSDRSQTSSAGANRGFSSLGGLSGLGSLGFGGWPSGPNPIGTPDRDRLPFSGAFSNSVFSPINELQSPGLGGLGVLSPGSNTIGRGSKLGSLFPAAMQAQMQGVENDGDERHGAFGAIGRGAFGSKEGEPLMAPARTPFDELLSRDESRGFSGEASQAFSQAPHAPNQPAEIVPQAQQRTMVMPDRMRWVYLDPQGHQQGPFSGLEMHDWYKASFFTADLAVKKLEDPEFEPLGQLIRRIGNSREPFLVPQIGIPHGPPGGQGAPFGSLPAGAVQPPFAGSFPSFGTTLTAEQQNNLERRKQEEQYLMARQREYLAQQQASLKQLQMQGGIPSSLQHHSSAHSLHSQPSFGSINSPMAIPQGPLPTGPGYFEPANRSLPGQGVPPEFFREEDLAQLSLHEKQSLFVGSLPGPSVQPPSFPQHADADVSRLQQAQQADPEGFKARLQEFEQLRSQHEADQDVALLEDERETETPPLDAEDDREPAAPEPLTLTQQVQKAASAKQSPAAPPVESPWAKVEPGIPVPFPPPQSTSPLPAPKAQRSRSNLPEALSMEPKSRSETPETASVAPWAKDTTEAPRGPSLKEIQEAEERKAAQAEAAAVAARRAALEQEMRNQPPPPVPGLPTTATWGTTASPAPSGGSSPWIKPATVKAQSSGQSTASKKTLADIQREEEARKQKLAAAAAATVVATTANTHAPSPSGKRYADLASKSTPSPSSGGGAWSTVGAGGKVKTPTGAAAVAAPRSVSASASKAARPATTRVSPPTAGSSAGAAHDEFIKWAKGALAKGLNSDINVDTFVHSLMTFPPESSLIADSVYANSQLMDGRRFAEEFIRRRKLAEKGIVENANTGTASSGAASDSKSGWSEVAKRNPVKDEAPSTAGFKMVPSKKRGKK